MTPRRPFLAPARRTATRGEDGPCVFLNDPDFPGGAYRGVVAPDQTIYLGHRFAAGGNRDTTTEAQLFEMYREYYKSASFIRVRGKLPTTKDTLGTNLQAKD